MVKRKFIHPHGSKGPNVQPIQPVGELKERPDGLLEDQTGQEFMREGPLKIVGPGMYTPPVKTEETEKEGFFRELGRTLSDMGLEFGRYVKDNPLNLAGIGFAAWAVPELLFNIPVALGLFAASGVAFAGQQVLNMRERRKQR
ncbi:MAG: hypothetical protein ABH851_05445 [Methanobacteriota archaeon]